MKATAKGKARKLRIIKKVILNEKQVSLLTGLYQTVIPVFKRDVMMFQKEEPMIRKIFPEQQQLVKTFFSNFIKPEPLVECGTAIQLNDWDVEKNGLPKNLIFMGKLQNLVNKKGKEGTFLSTVLNTYIGCGRYIRKKLPLQNENLLAK